MLVILRSVHEAHHAKPYYHVSIDGPELVVPFSESYAPLFNACRSWFPFFWKFRHFLPPLCVLLSLQWPLLGWCSIASYR
jgi:hypothetical protein